MRGREGTNRGETIAVGMHVVGAAIRTKIRDVIRGTVWAYAWAIVQVEAGTRTTTRAQTNEQMIIGSYDHESSSIGAASIRGQTIQSTDEKFKCNRAKYRTDPFMVARSVVDEPREEHNNQARKMNS